MRVRGTQKHVKPIEVNVDTVYVRSNVIRIETDEFVGWEYDEVTSSVREYVETLNTLEDAESMALILSIVMGEIDFLRSRVEILEGVQ